MANGRVAKLVDATDFSEIGNVTKFKTNVRNAVYQNGKENHLYVNYIISMVIQVIIE
jgi:hypothetical protein